MHLYVLHAFAALIVAGHLTTGLAASDAIGMVAAKGSFLIDNTKMVGNATLFDGNTLETDAASSELKIQGGVHVLLGITSRATVYRDRLVLEQGGGQIDGSAEYRVEARNLSILPVHPKSSAQVSLKGTAGVQIAALGGGFQVRNANGMLVANMVSGSTLVFEAQQTGEDLPTFTMSGCLTVRDGHYLLTDELVGVTEELVGSDLGQHVNRVVEVTATVAEDAVAVAGAEEVIRVERIRRTGGSCVVPPPAVATGAQQQTPRPAAPTPPVASEGMSGTAKAVIAGVVIAGAGGGAAAYYFLTQEEEKNTISR